MRKRELTAFGKQIKFKLIEKNESQEWLIAQLREKSGMYVDSSNLYKLTTGDLNSKALESYIREILEIPADQDKTE